MDPIAIMIRETKVLRQSERVTTMDEIIEQFPNAHELQLEDEADRRMKESYVDAFTILIQNNLRFCMRLLKTDLMQRIFEQKERLEDEDDNDDETLLSYAVILSREHIEDLFIE